MTAVRAAERVPLGRTRLTVSRMGMGTAALGGLYERVADAQAQAAVRRAHELGLRLFDTAPLYGSGLAERRLGAALADLPRDDLVVATKVGRLLRAGATPDATQHHDGESFYKGTPPVNPVFDFSYQGALRSLEESLARLGLDRVDVVHIHDPDEHLDEALAGAYPALDRLRADGVIGAVSAGMNAAAPLARLAREADFDCLMVAGRYTLLDQIAAEDMLDVCTRRGIAVLVAGAYNSGILCDPRPGARFDYVPAASDRIQTAQRIAQVCRRHGVPLMAAALQFPLGHRAVTAVVTGGRSVAEVEQNVALFDVAIPAELWQELRAEGLLPDAVPVPEPGGAA